MQPTRSLLPADALSSNDLPPMNVEVAAEQTRLNESCQELENEFKQNNRRVTELTESNQAQIYTKLNDVLENIKQGIFQAELEKVLALPAEFAESNFQL